MDNDAAMRQLQASAGLLHALSPRLGGSARSRALVHALDANLTLPDGWASTTACSQCRALRVPGDSAVVRADRYRSRKRRRTADDEPKQRVRFACAVCGHVDTLDGASAAQRKDAARATVVNAASSAAAPPAASTAAPAPVRTADAPPKKKRRKEANPLKAMLAAKSEREAADRAQASSKLGGSLSSFLSELDAQS